MLLGILALLLFFAILIGCLALLGMIAHFASGLLYRHLVEKGYARAQGARAASFYAIFFGTLCLVGFIFFSTFRFQR
jgi:hypothetical protein